MTIAVLDSVVLIVRELGETESWKSAGAIVTFSVTTTHFTRDGLTLVPVTFMGYDPIGVESGTVTVKAEVAVPPAGGRGAGGLKLYVAPGGKPEATFKVTDELKVPKDLTVIVNGGAVVPCGVESEVGDASSENALGGGPCTNLLPYH